MDARDLECRLASSGGRIPGNRRASIVFPVPGGPARSRLCHLPQRARAPAARVPVRVRRRGRPQSLRRGRLRLRGARLQLELAAEISNRLGEVADGEAATPASAASCARLGWAEEPLDAEPRAPSATARTPPTRRSRPSRASSPTAAGSRSAAPATETTRKNSERDRQVEAGAFLSKLGGREVDGDPAVRKVQRRGGDAAANAFPRLLDTRGRRVRRSRNPGRRRECAPRRRPAAARGRRERA